LPAALRTRLERQYWLARAFVKGFASQRREYVSGEIVSFGAVIELIYNRRRAAYEVYRLFRHASPRWGLLALEAVRAVGPDCAYCLQFS
jgi:hypothetical protein